MLIAEFYLFINSGCRESRDEPLFGHKLVITRYRFEALSPEDNWMTCCRYLEFDYCRYTWYLDV